MSENQTEVVKFLNYLSNPYALSNIDLSEVKDWVNKYPYSQSLKFIAVKASQKNSNYQDFLAQAATIAPSRKLLHDFIHQPESFNSIVLPFNLEDTQTIEDRQIAVAKEETNSAIEDPSNFAFGVDINEIFGSDCKPEKVEEEKKGEGQETKPEHEIENIEEETKKENIEEEVLVFADPETFEEIDETKPKLEIENIEEESIKEEVLTANDLKQSEETKEEFTAQNIEKENAVIKQESAFQNTPKTDFFALNRKDNFEEKQGIEVEIKTDESVSTYNDEGLPYTFLWWLNKTRKEHAKNLQPYSTFKLDMSKKIQNQPSASLNHQIAENIFHLRGVEELSSSAFNYTVPFDFRKKEFQIIDKFIKEEPQIRPLTANKLDSENKAKKSSEDINQMVSETLAKIYVEQMLYHKALDVYKKLSLKFPEKSIYFASRIRYLELKVN